jgi:hypothetical protein
MQHATKYSVYLGGKYCCGCRTKGCDRFSSSYALYKIRFVVVLFNSFRQQCADDSVGWLANYWKDEAVGEND